MTPTRRASLLAGLVLALSLLQMGVYTTRVLHGNPDNRALSARMFGLPERLVRHGLVPFYRGERETGWDGQFYLSIANDPLARRDTTSHLDYDAYRYQRVGIPAIAWLVSRLAGQNWVSPTTDYFTSLALVALATFAAASYLALRGIGPWWILFWSLSLGVQITLLNGLPDAGADALLLLAAVALSRRWRVAFALFATFAALAREAYVVFPAVLALLLFARTLRRDGPSRRLDRSIRTALASAWPALVPLAAFAAWQVFVRWRFDHDPSSQVADILAPPLTVWFAYLRRALTGTHPLMPGSASWHEAFGLIGFALLLVAGAWVAVSALRSSNRDDLAQRSIAWSLLVLCALYTCFGRVVMEIYFGYMKAGSVLYLLPVLLLPAIGPAGRMALCALYVVTGIGMTLYLWDDRFVAQPLDADAYTRQSQVVATEPITCLPNYRSAVQLVGFESFHGAGTWLGHLSSDTTGIVRVAVTNRTDEIWKSTRGPGSVNIGYRWFSSGTGDMVQDGIRTYLPAPLSPGETIVVPLVVRFPESAGDYRLRIAPVQENCAWFDAVQPSNSLDLSYGLH